ncbi:hypothetical protein BaRGS_00007368, partial [Batillaria attramentaria]
MCRGSMGNKLQNSVKGEHDLWIMPTKENIKDAIRRTKPLRVAASCRLKGANSACGQPNVVRGGKKWNHGLITSEIHD